MTTFAAQLATYVASNADSADSIMAQTESLVAAFFSAPQFDMRCPDGKVYVPRKLSTPMTREERIVAHRELLDRDNAAYAEALQECEGVMPFRALVDALHTKYGESYSQEYEDALWRLAEADYERLSEGEP